MAFTVQYDRRDETFHVFRDGVDLGAASENLANANEEMDRLARAAEATAGA